MPMPPLVRVGVWEDGKFVGCVLFGRGASSSLGSPYGLDQTQCAELVRVAMTTHVNPVTRVVSLAIKFLAKHSPGLRLIVSFADPSQGHHGGVSHEGGTAMAPPAPVDEDETLPEEAEALTLVAAAVEDATPPPTPNRSDPGKLHAKTIVTITTKAMCFMP
jgi:hypothetical protein